MKVVQVNGGDKGGGATNASYRLHHELLSRGHDSYILAAKTTAAEERIAKLPEHSLLERVGRRYWDRKGLNNLEIRSSFRLRNHEYLRDGNPALHFHNIHGGYFNYRALAKATRNQPAVWTLHDMWAFTGHCVYSYDCNRWRTGCGQCPYPDEYPRILRDATDEEWKLKQQTYAKSQLFITSPSRWLAQLAQEGILGKFDIRAIPNGIDTKVFQPGDKAQLRRELDIDEGRVVLLWGTHQLTDLRKGGDVIAKLAETLPSEFRDRVTLLAFGSGTEALPEQLPGMDVRPFGFVKTDEEMARVLSAADILLFPSRADNLPFTVMEALACGLPVVAFDVGGIPEMVRDGDTGFLVPPFEIDQFVGKVLDLADSDEIRHRMAQDCRRIAVAEYGIDLMADRYLSLYEEIQSSK